MLIQKARQRITALEMHRTRFALKAVLIDFGVVAAVNEAAARLARDVGIDHLIWQDPDHEGFVLRHLPECQTRRPPRGRSLDALLREWPEYSKPMAAAQLAIRLELAHVHRACAVEAELQRFIQAIGL